MNLKDRNNWVWGFNIGSETWNGRLAMLGFVLILIIELVTQKGILHFFSLI